MRIRTTGAATLLAAACTTTPIDWGTVEANSPPGTPPTFPSPQDAPVDAVTLARTEVDGVPHVLGVVEDLGDALRAVDLTAALGGNGDPLALVASAGLDVVAGTIASGRAIDVPLEDLLPPVVTGDRHVAAAENYPEHAEEVDNGDTVPYLFPKVVAPTPAIAEVIRGEGELLDYEVELCFTFAQPVGDGTDLAGATVGYLLCNDLTDRAIQIRDADLLDPTAAAGFTDAKSKPGYLPLGPVVVVPRDPAALFSEIALSLWVNGELRQASPATEMTWPPDEIVHQVLAIGPDPRWTFGGEPIALYDGDTIPPGTLFLSGTPAGVVFRPPDGDFILGALADYALGGFLSGMGPEDFVAESYVEAMLADGGFLAPGDLIEADGGPVGRQWITVR